MSFDKVGVLTTKPQSTVQSRSLGPEPANPKKSPRTRIMLYVAGFTVSKLTGPEVNPAAFPGRSASGIYAHDPVEV